MINWIQGILDQDTSGEFDASLAHMIRTENELEDPQYPVQHSISKSFTREYENIENRKSNIERTSDYQHLRKQVKEMESNQLLWSLPTPHDLDTMI